MNEKITLGLNDVLIVKLTDEAAADYVEYLHQQLKLALPDHAELNKIIFLPKEVEFQVIKAESIDDILLDKKGE